jgi:hypothetical protein
MSRILSVQQHPEWFGLSDAEQAEFIARTRKRMTVIPSRLKKVIGEHHVEDEEESQVEDSEELDDRCSS